MRPLKLQLKQWQEINAIESKPKCARCENEGIFPLDSKIDVPVFGDTVICSACGWTFKLKGREGKIDD